MTAYSDYLLNTAALNTVALWPLNDASGSSAVDLAASPSNGTYVNSPTLTDIAPDYQDPTNTCARTLASSQLFTLPTTKITRTRLLAEWTFHIWVRYRGINLGDGEPAIALCGSTGAGGTGNNAFSIWFRARNLVNSTNGVLCYVSNGSGTGTYANSPALDVSGVPRLYDRMWHLVTVRKVAAAAGTMVVGVDGEFDAAATGVDACIPDTMPTLLGFGDWYLGATPQSFYGCNFDFAYPSFHTSAHSDTQIFALADQMNGNLGTAVEYPDAARALFAKARTQIVAVAQIGDSNSVKATSADSLQLVQGYILTAPTWIEGATGRKLASILVSGMQPGAGGTEFLGITEYLLNGGLGTITHITDRNLEYWNTDVSVNADPSRGFRHDAKYFPAGTKTAANSFITCDTTDENWSMAASGTFTVYYDHATFSAGAGSISPSTIVNGALINFTTIATNTGANSWVEASTISTGPVAVGQAFTFGFASTGHDITGPAGTSHVHFHDVSRTTGFTLTSFWANGGHSAYTVCQALADASTTMTKLELFMSALIQPQTTLGQTPCVMLEILEGPNDRNERGNRSYTYDDVLDTFSNASPNDYSDGEEGYFNNLNTIYLRMRKAFTNIDGLAANFFCKLGPYHRIAADPGDWHMQQQYARAERRLCALYPGKVFRCNNSITSAEMEAASGYDDTAGTDYLHLLRAGYVLMGTQAGQDLEPYYPDDGARGISGPLRKLLLGV